MYSRAEQGIFVWGQSCGTDIFIKTTPNTHLYIHTDIFYYYYTHTYIHTLFYLISFLYTHTQQKKKELSIFNQNYV